MTLSAPQLIVVAGPNGSGKSTLTQFLLKRGYDFGHYINPDEIAAGLKGSYEARVSQAQRQADFERERCLQDGIDFSFETVMSHPSKIEVMTRARMRGFEVTLFFVSIADPRINVARVKGRVMAGGHDVPSDRIVARWHRAMASLAAAVLAVDRAIIFDNTDIPAGAVVASDPDIQTALSGGLRPVAEIVVTKATVEITLTPDVPDWIERYLVEPLRDAASRDFAAARALLVRTENR